MRWTNWYTHPGDTRYRVFSFGAVLHANEFSADLDAAGIEYERHEEDGEFLFGLHRSYFKEALRLNHLLHARHRPNFIPDRNFRWGLLVFTGAVVALAVYGFLTSL
jgi:hypothetical protein